MRSTAPWKRLASPRILVGRLCGAASELGECAVWSCCWQRGELGHGSTWSEMWDEFVPEFIPRGRQTGHRAGRLE